MKKLIAVLLLFPISAMAFTYPPCDPSKGNPTVCVPQNGKDGATGLTGEADHLLSVNVGAGVRWYDWRYVSLNSGYRYDIQNHDNEVDAMILNFKIGPDYTQRMLEAQNRQIEALQGEVAAMRRPEPRADSIDYTTPNSIWFVSSDGKVQKAKPEDADYVKALLRSGVK